MWKWICLLLLPQTNIPYTIINTLDTLLMSSRLAVLKAEAQEETNLVRKFEKWLAYETLADKLKARRTLQMV